MSAFGVGGGNWLANEEINTDPVVASPISRNGSLSDYEENARTQNIPIGTANNSKSQQSTAIDPSSGELLMLDQVNLDTYGAETLKVVNGGSPSKISTSTQPSIIGANGEVYSTLATKNSAAPVDIFSGTTGTLLITVIGTIVAGIVLYLLLGRKS